MQEIKDICNNNNDKIEVVQLFSEVSKPRMNSEPEEKHGIDEFISVLEELVGKVKGIDKLL